MVKFTTSNSTSTVEDSFHNASKYRIIIAMKKLIVISAISFVLSILSAIAADMWLSERVAVVGAFAGLQYSLNPGIAWGIRLPPVIQEILIGAALCAVAYMAYMEAKQSKKTFSFQLLAFSFILGGGFANIVDRLIDGFVTDYFQIGSFPIFNVADSFVTVGVGMLLLETVLRRGASS